MRSNGWRTISTRDRIEAGRYVASLPENTAEQRRAKKILSYFVLDNLSASAIKRLNDPEIVCASNRAHGAPLSTSSILAIVYEHFPQFKKSKTRTNNPRVELICRREKQCSPHIKQCAFCGCTERLEEHHMIPLSMGGTNDDRNLVFLCHACHADVSAYQGELRKGLDLNGKP